MRFDLKTFVKDFVKSLMPFEQDSDAGIYPFLNSQYGTRELSSTDYLRLYTGWVYVATSTISDTMAGLEHGVFKVEKEAVDKYSNLVTYDFVKKVASHMLLTGNCFVYKQMIGKKVDSLAILRSDMVTFEENPNGSLRSYLYGGTGTNLTIYPNEMINFEMFSPFQSYPMAVKGVSPMQAVAIQAEMDGTANRWNWNFFKNGGSVRDILSTNQAMKPEVKQRLISKWKAEFQGVNNAHKVAILDNDLKYSSVGGSQKEMDFVESRRFTRDEILAIYKLPKAVIGITDDVNRASAMEAQKTYRSVCIAPFAEQISQTITRDLYNNEVTFKFLNIVPADTEQFLQDLNAGTITVNEYRKIRGFEPIKNGDVLKIADGSTTPSEGAEKPKDEKSQYSGIVSKIIRKQINGTPEYEAEREKQGEKKWKARTGRTDKYEAEMVKAVNRIFTEQEKDVLKLKRISKATLPKLDGAKYKTLWQTLIAPMLIKVIEKEGNEALSEVGISALFEIGDPTINEFIRKDIEKFAQEVDMETKRLIFDIIEAGNVAGIGPEAIATNVSKAFDTFRKSRSLTIARTEITNASTFADLKAWQDSGVVSGKEWYTALDERVCANCGPMNGKKQELPGKFFEKGDEAPGGLKLDYKPIIGPTLHPNCRCTMLPILK